MNNEDFKYRKKALEELVKYGDLIKYRKDRLQGYIKKCLDSLHLIEAHTLAIQYVENTVQLAIDTGRTSDSLSGRSFNFWTAIVVLRSLGYVNESFFGKYNTCALDIIQLEKSFK